MHKKTTIEPEEAKRSLHFNRRPVEMAGIGRKVIASNLLKALIKPATGGPASTSRYLSGVVNSDSHTAKLMQDTSKKSPLELINKVPSIKFEGMIAACEGDTNPVLGRLSSSFHSTTEKTAIGIASSPAQIQKLIASQSDPLLAKEIFDLAARQPNFHHSYSTFHTLILKLGRSHHFSLMHNILSRLNSQRYSVPPSFFSHIIRIYGDANLPDKALKTFSTILQFNIKPHPKHLNLILQILVSSRNYLRPAFDLFKSAHRYHVNPNTKSYNILMRAFCLDGHLSIAYQLFNQMLKRDVVPDIESYRILMQGLSRKGQVNTAIDLLEDMLNKGFVPDTLTYTTLLNSLCRKKKLREAYKLLCRMKVKGCNPDIVHYNTVILGFCREGRALDACKILEDMPANGCLPNLVSYRTLIIGLCDQGVYDEALVYLEQMLLKGFSPRSVSCALIKGLCNVGKIYQACGILDKMLDHGEAPHAYTWTDLVTRICGVETERMGDVLKEVLKVDLEPGTRLVDAGAGLEEYIIQKSQVKCRKL